MAIAGPTFSVGLHHLAPGAKAAGLGYPDEQLAVVTLPQLRELLQALSAVAARQTIYEPSTPEIRIKTEREVFTIRTRYRRLCFVGWEMILRGQDHSVGYILSVVTGTDLIKPSKGERNGSASPTATRPPTTPAAGTSTAPFAYATPAGRARNGNSRWIKIVSLAVVIIGLNSATAWMIFRPVPALVPKYVLLPEAESHALLAKTAGEYQTGEQEGDRRLIVNPDGTLRIAKFGLQRAVLEERTRSSRGALAGGRAALITSDPALITIKDTNTLVLSGNTYKRRSS